MSNLKTVIKLLFIEWLRNQKLFKVNIIFYHLKKIKNLSTWQLKYRSSWIASLSFWAPRFLVSVDWRMAGTLGLPRQINQDGGQIRTRWQSRWDIPAAREMDGLFHSLSFPSKGRGQCSWARFWCINQKIGDRWMAEKLHLLVMANVVWNVFWNG